jgi:hypothetical protein
MADNITRPSIPDMIAQILLQNQDKNFVQRMIKPDISPVLMDYAGPGIWGTHLMTGKSDEYGNTIIYPQIVQMPGDNNLQLLSPDAAREYALKNNEYMKMNSPQEANWFGQNYKKVWGW